MMKRLLGLLLMLLLLPCAVLAEELALLGECSVQTPADIAAVQDVIPLPNGNAMIRYYEDVGDGVYTHHMAIVTPEGACVWDRPSGNYRLAMMESCEQEIILRPDSFIWEYYPAGTRNLYCYTEFGYDGGIRQVELDLQSRDGELSWRSFPDFNVSILWDGEGALHMEAFSLRTGASALLPVHAMDTIDLMQLGDWLGLLVRGEEGCAKLYLYDASMKTVRQLLTPIHHGEIVKMALQGDTLTCFAMYAGDWESYIVYTCDIRTGKWLDDRPMVTLPNEYCGLRNVIPCGDSFLLLINEGDTPEHPAPFGPMNWNYTDNNLYAMAPDGSLSLLVDAQGDARLMPWTQADRFTLLMPGGEGYVLRTYGLMQELPLP